MPLGIPARQSPWTRAAVVYAAVIVVCASFPWWAGSVWGELASRLAFLPLDFATIGLFWCAARTRGIDPRTATALRLFAAATGCAVVGNIWWSQYVFWAHRDPMWSWPANIPYLAFFPLAIAAFLRLPRARRTQLEWWKFVLDTLIVLVGSAVMIWHIVFRAATTGEVSHHLVLALVYPVGGLVLLFGITTVALRPPGGRYTPAFGLLLGGEAVSIVGDVLATFIAPAQLGGASWLADSLYAVSYVLLIASGERYLRSPDGAVVEDSDGPTRHAPFLAALPYAVAGALGGLVSYVAVSGEPAQVAPLVAAAAPVAILVLARGLVAAQQNARLLTERAARAGEERFRSLVQHASDAILIVDAAGIIRFASPAAQRVLAPTVAGLEGSALLALVDTPDELVLATLLADARRAPRISAGATWRVRDQDGTIRYLETTATDLSNDPAVGGLVLTARDVTERHDLQERLGHAQRLEAVGQLAGGVAHDFNNILTAISGNAELALAELPGGTPAAESVAEIRAAVRRATELTRQLLAFSRKQVLRPQIVGINSVVAGCERMLTRLIGDDVRLDVSLSPNVPLIVADPGQLEQALVNLVVNARDAMPEGGRVRIETAQVIVDALEARAWPGFSPGRYVRIAVHDTGTGMDDATRTRVFEPFFTTKPPGRGTGLGLSTVYGIVKQSGGYVYVASAPGHGSTFTMFFPVAPAAYTAGTVPGGERETPLPVLGRERTPMLASIDGAGHSGATVLIVEDEPAVRAAMAQALARRGFNVLQAADGADGVEVGARHAGPIDLVITDVVMPYLTGPAMLDRLRRGRPGLRALFVSGYAAPQLRGPLAAATTFLEKPFTLVDLTRRVSDLLAAPKEALRIDVA